MLKLDFVWFFSHFIYSLPLETSTVMTFHDKSLRYRYTLHIRKPHGIQQLGSWPVGDTPGLDFVGKKPSSNSFLCWNCAKSFYVKTHYQIIFYWGHIVVLENRRIWARFSGSLARKDIVTNPDVHDLSCRKREKIKSSGYHSFRSSSPKHPKQILWKPKGFW